MRIRRTERIDDAQIEVFIEDWPREGESEEVFEERLLRFAERLVMLNASQPAEEKEGDA